MTLDERIENAKIGRDYWINLIEKYQIKTNDYVVLLPHEDEYYSEWVIKYLPQFIEKKKVQKVVLLTRDKALLNNSLSSVTTILINQKDTEALLQFYCLYQFATNFLIASLDVPVFRLGKGYLKMGKTLEEAFKIIIFDLGE